MHILKRLCTQLIALKFMNGWQHFKVHCNISMTQKFKATLSKNEDEIKNEDDLNNEDYLKNEDNLKNENGQKNHKFVHTWLRR